MSNPWMKFYPSAWRSDPALRVCSLAARGLWIEMLCLMHEAEPRGTLRINGNAMNARQIAALVGGNSAEVQRCLAELEAAGVYSRDANGVIFSRRMVRDTLKAEKDKANGAEGGSPLLKGVNPPDNPPVKAGVKAKKIEARSEKEESHPSDARPPTDEADAANAVEIYNQAAGLAGWPLVQRLTAPRRSGVLARLRDCGGLDGWRAALERARASAFLCGSTGWKADFDFFCQAKSFTKLMEGSYDDHAATASATKPHDTIFRALAAVAQQGGGEHQRQAGADDGSLGDAAAIEGAAGPHLEAAQPHHMRGTG
jgi:hypothetical protein